MDTFGVQTRRRSGRLDLERFILPTRDFLLNPAIQGCLNASSEMDSESRPEILAESAETPYIA